MSLAGQWDAVNGEVPKCPTVQASKDHDHLNVWMSVFERPSTSVLRHSLCPTVQPETSPIRWAKYTNLYFIRAHTKPNYELQTQLVEPFPPCRLCRALSWGNLFRGIAWNRGSLSRTWIPKSTDPAGICRSTRNQDADPASCYSRPSPIKLQ